MSDTRAQIKDIISEFIISGGNLTTAEGLRTVLDAITDACVNLVDDSGLLGGGGSTKDFDSTKPYKNGDSVFNGGLIWVAVGDKPPGPFDSSGGAWTNRNISRNVYSYHATGAFLPWEDSQAFTALDNLTDFINGFYKLDGSKTLTGNMNAGGFNIGNAGIVTATGGLSTDGTPSIFLDTTNSVFLFGASAGSGQSGTSVFAIGNSAAIVNTGNSVIAIGDSAAYTNSNSGVIAIGGSAAYANTGQSVTGIGIQAALQNTGDFCTFFGRQAGYLNTGSNVTAIGQNAATSNTLSGIFTVAGITDVYWNNPGDQGNTTLMPVTLQTAMAPNGTDSDASASVQAFAAARATGNATPGNLKWMYSPPLSSGSTRQTLALAATMDGATGNFKFEKKVNLTLQNYASNALAIAGGLSTGDLYQNTGVVMVVF